MAEHRTLSGASLHENKGVSTAANNEVATASSGVTDWKKLTNDNVQDEVNPFARLLTHAVHRVAANTSGGSTGNGVWNIRPLNILLTDEITGTTLSANQLTLPVGNYYAEAESVVNRAGYNKLRLRNVSQGTTLVVGMGTYASQDNNDTTSVSTLSGRFNITGASRKVRLEHYTENQKGTDGLGVGHNAAENEIFGSLKIWKVNT